MAVTLASKGYYEGDPEKVLNGRADLVLAAMQYEVFRVEIEAEAAAAFTEK